MKRNSKRWKCKQNASSQYYETHTLVYNRVSSCLQRRARRRRWWRACRTAGRAAQSRSSPCRSVRASRRPRARRVAARARRRAHNSCGYWATASACRAPRRSNFPSRSNSAAFAAACPRSASSSWLSPSPSGRPSLSPRSVCHDWCSCLLAPETVAFPVKMNPLLPRSALKQNSDLISRAQNF